MKREKTIHILLVEDEAAHAALIRRAFESRAGKVRLTVARSLREARASLAESTPDLALVDLLLPDGKGRELLPAEGEESPYPIVIVTSHGDEQAAVEALKAGALDYVVKSEATLADMPRIVERALREWGHIVQRKRTESIWRALNAAAALQRAGLGEAEVYQAVSEQLIALDLRGLITLLDEAADCFVVEYIAAPAGLIKAIERLTGLTAIGFRFPRARVPIFAQAVEGGQAVYVVDGPTQLARAFPESISGLAGRVAALLGPARVILAPLWVGGRVAGLLHVAAESLSEADVPAITAFADQLSAALENARLFQVEQRGHEAAAALLDITQMASSSLELTQVLQRIAQRTAAACQANRCTIFLLDDSGEILQPVMSQFADGHVDPEQWQAIKATTADRLEAVPFLHEVMRQRRPLLLEDPARSDQMPLKLTQPFGVQKLLVVPLLSRDRVIGLLALDHAVADRDFTPEQIDLAQTIGGHVASAIVNARLYAEAEQRAREQTTLLATSTAISAHIELDQALAEITRQMTLALNGTSCYISTWDATEGTLTVAAEYYGPEANAQERVSDLGESYRLSPRGRAQFEAPEAVLEHVSATDSDYATHLKAYGGKTALTYPLIVRGRLLGALELWDSRRERTFTEAEISLGRTIANQAAVSLENAQLFEATRQRLDELTVLHTVATAGVEAAMEDELIERITQIVGETLYPDNFGVLLLAEREAASVLRVHPSYRGVREETKGDTIALGHGITGTVAANGQPWRVPDVGREPKYLDVHPDTRSELCVPLKAGERVIGVLNAESSELDAFSEADEQLLTTIAGQLATAIEKVRLFEQTRRRAEETGALLATIQAIASLELEAVLETIASYARALFDADGSRIHLIEPDGETLRCVVALHERAEAALDVTLKLGEGITGRVALKGEPELVPHTLTDPDALQMPGTPVEPESLALALLKARGRVIGVMTVSRLGEERPFTPADLTFLTAFANQAAVALENAQLFEAERRQAEQLAALHTTQADIAIEHDLPALLHTIVERATGLLAGTGGGLYLCNPKRQEARCVVSYNTLRDYTGTVLKYGEGAAGVVALSGEPLIIDDYRTWSSRAGAFEDEQPFTAVLSAPMIWQGQVTGVIHVLHDVEARRFTEADLKLLTLFANQAAIAIENARLHTELQQHSENLEVQVDERTAELAYRVDQLEHLRELADSLLGAASLDETLRLLAEGVVTRLAYDYAGVGLRHEEEQAFVIRAVYPLGPRIEEVRALLPTPKGELLRLPLTGKSPAAEQASSGEAMVVTSLADFAAPSIPRAVANSLQKLFGIGCLHSVPLLDAGEVVGVLMGVVRAPELSSQQQQGLTLLAGQAALAIRQARLYEAEQQRSQQLRAVGGIAREMAAILDPTQLVNETAQMIVDAFGYYGAAVALREGDEIRVYSRLAAGGAEKLEEIRFKIGQRSIIAWVCEHGEAALVNDVSQDPRYRAVRGKPETRAELAVPLLHKGQVIGALNVESSQLNAFGPADLDVMGTLAAHVVIALESARLYEAEQQRAAELKTERDSLDARVAARTAEIAQRNRQLLALQSAGAAITSSLDLQWVLDSVTEEMANLLAVEACAISDWNQVDDTVRLLAEYGPPDWWDKEPADNVSHLAEYPLTKRVLVERRPQQMTVGQPDVDPAELAVMQEMGAKTLLMLPMVFQDRVVGLVELMDSRVERSFTEQEISPAQLLANQAAIAIENARLYQSAREAAERRAVLHRAGQEIGASLAPEQVYEAVHQAVMQLMPCDAFVIALLHEARQEIKVVYRIDRGELAPVQRMPTSRGLSGHVIATGEPLRIDDFDPETSGIGVVRFGDPEHVRSILAAPLRLGRKIIGMLSAQSYQPYAYTAENQELLELLAAHAATALDNARLFAEVQRLSITDDLTGLYNRRYFEQQLTAEFKRARRYGRPLALIMLDLDNLKQINDKYGHPAGDVALTQFAALLRANVRGTDVLARYGGDEFAVILLETDLTSAVGVAEKACQAVAAHSFTVEKYTPSTGTGHRLHMTASLGVAALPDQDPADPDELVRLADTALYQAKERGRNRVHSIADRGMRNAE